MNNLTKRAGFGLILSSFFTMSALTQDTKRDDAEITTLVKTMEEGWAKKDGKLFARPFAEQADYVIINGMHVNGKAGIALGHQQIFDTFYKETAIKTTVESIRYPRPDVAITHVGSNLTGTVYGKAVDIKARITLTLLKEAGKWEIQAFQNTGIDNQTAPPQPTSH